MTKLRASLRLGLLLPLALAFLQPALNPARADSCVTVSDSTTTLTTTSLGTSTLSTQTAVTVTVPCPSPTPPPTPTPSSSPPPTASPSPTTGPGSGHPSPSPSPHPTPSPRPVSGLTPLQQQQENQRQRLIAEVRGKLGYDIAAALQTQDELTTSLAVNVNQSAALAARVERAAAKIQRLDAQIAGFDASILRVQARLATQRRVLAELARELYAQPDSMLLQLAEAGSLGQALTNYADILSAASEAETLKAQLESDGRTLGLNRARLNTAREEEQLSRDQLSAALSQLATLQTTEQATGAALSRHLKGFEGELVGIDKQSPELASQITTMLEQEQETIIAEATQAVWDQVEALAATQAGTLNLQLPPTHSKYRFNWPEPKAVITQPFGPTTNAMEPPYEAFPHFHTGIDLAEPLGSPVFAAASGVVILVGDSIVNGQQVGYGNFVVLQHADGFTTLYGHLLAPLVKVGQPVKAGQPIGLEGSTGNSTGPHVHFEVRLNGQFLDPVPFLPPGGPGPD